MFTSFSTALSALNAHSTAVDVVGNNLANVNTPGYKTSVVYFRDLVTQSLGAGLGETQVGFGTGRPLTIRQFTQGAIQASTGLLDAAIQGDGFFVLRDAQDSQTYTRAGSFHVDNTGRMLTNTGERVQGWTVDPATGEVNTTSAIGDIVVPVGTLKPPAATTDLSVDLNLNASAPVGATSKFSTDVKVYDSLGGSHVLTITFEKTDANEWQYDVTIPGEDVESGTAGTPFPIPDATGTLTFGEDGLLTDPAAGSLISFEISDPANGSNPISLNWDPYNGASARITQFAKTSASSANHQNGSPAAQLDRVGLADGGRILAQYSDGQQVVIGQLALASIRNPESLVSVGNNNYTVSAGTATPSIGLEGTGGRGTIHGGAIEYSTVDIAREFTNLIVLQRGYQANSRVINTVDELSQEIINLKR
jgi:flagellar hook protein FlgE